MTELEKKIQEIEESLEYHQGTYWKNLVDLCKGDLDRAARFDLAIDGNHYYAHMNQRPFAGDQELKDAYWKARNAQVEFVLIAIARVRQRESSKAPNQQNGDQS